MNNVMGINLNFLDFDTRIIVEVPISDHVPVDNLQGTVNLIKQELNFGHVGTNIAMTHVLVLSAEMRRNQWLNEWLWQTLDIDNMFGPTFGLNYPRILNLRNGLENNVESS